MPKFLFKVNYTLEGLNGVRAQGGKARKAAATSAAKSVGGRLESFYFAFGSTDVYTVIEFPDNTSAAAMALAVSAAGGAKVETVALLSPEEIDDAVGKKVSYKPPKA